MSPHNSPNSIKNPDLKASNPKSKGLSIRLRNGSIIKFNRNTKDSFKGAHTDGLLIYY